SVEKSLENLQTHYIDVLYLHWWDYTTSIEEVMQSLNVLVTQGKVLYLGVSDAPAWIVSKANQYARDHGLAQFVVYQGKWSTLERDLETECIPMSLDEGMAIAPYGVLGSGKFQSKAALEKREKEGEGLRTWIGRNKQDSKEIEMSNVLENIGNELGGASVTAVALAYTLQKYPYVFPIIGGRKVAHLHDNLKALEIQLEPRHFESLEKVLEHRWGFPVRVLGPLVTLTLASQYTYFGRRPGDNFFMKASGHYDFVSPQSVSPSLMVSLG
ncbi:Aldo/keto reductase, partial [Atractiella rhizophila]